MKANESGDSKMVAVKDIHAPEHEGEAEAEARRATTRERRGKVGVVGGTQGVAVERWGREQCKGKVG